MELTSVVRSGLRFVRVANRGDLNKERVVLRVRTSVNLFNYIVAGMQGSSEEEGDAVDLNRDFFWFPNAEVEIGNLVLLYTKSGNNRTYTNDRGQIYHAFFWGKSSPVWTEETDTVSVLRLAGWNFYPVVPSDVEQDQE